jgi:citronellol/citronellal dehydrogenase
MLGGDPLVKRSRNPDIMADAAHAILTRRSRRVTGQFFIDDEVLLAEVRCMCYYEA